MGSNRHRLAGVVLAVVMASPDGAGAVENRAAPKANAGRSQPGGVVAHHVVSGAVVRSSLKAFIGPERSSGALRTKLLKLASRLRRAEILRESPGAGVTVPDLVAFADRYPIGLGSKTSVHLAGFSMGSQYHPQLRVLGLRLQAARFGPEGQQAKGIVRVDLNILPTADGEFAVEFRETPRLGQRSRPRFTRTEWAQAARVIEALTEHLKHDPALGVAEIERVPVDVADPVR